MGNSIITLGNSINVLESDVRILKLLLDSRESFTIKGIANYLKINYRIAHERVGVLEKEGSVKVMRVGNSKLCEFAFRFDNKVYEAEYLRMRELCKNKDFLVLRNRLAELNFVFVALVFGSHVKGAANKHSDIDVLTIGGDKKEIEATMNLLPNIHLTAVSVEEFIHMAKRKDFSVVNEAIKNNIILLGREEYYRLLENAQK